MQIRLLYVNKTHKIESLHVIPGSCTCRLHVIWYTCEWPWHRFAFRVLLFQLMLFSLQPRKSWNQLVHLCVWWYASRRTQKVVDRFGWNFLCQWPLELTLKVIFIVSWLLLTQTDQCQNTIGKSDAVQRAFTPLASCNFGQQCGHGLWYTPWLKKHTLLLPITLPNIGQFSKFFHQQTQQWLC